MGKMLVKTIGESMKAKTQIKIKEDSFTEIDNKKPDSRNRITIPSKILEFWERMGGMDSVRIDMNEKGEVLLRPESSIPLSEMWLYENQDLHKVFQDGINDAKKNRVTKVKDLDKFID